MSLNEILRRLSGKSPQIAARIEAELAAELASHHLTDDQKRLIPQMIERTALTPSEVMAAARNPARITSAMLAKLTDPAHRTPATQDAFSRVLQPVLTRLLGDGDVATTLRPAFEQAVAESLAFLGEQVELLTQQLKVQSGRMGVGEALLRTLARRYAPGSEGDLLQAHAGLELALEAAQRVIAQGAMPSNLDAQVQATLAEVSRLLQNNHPVEATALVDRELTRLADEVAERNQARSQLHQTAIDLARTQNNSKSAANHILAKLKLDTPSDLFEALRAEQDRWYVTGRDQGGAFDLELSIHLAEAAVGLAQTPDQRGAAATDLGMSMQTLGTRESNATRLRSAIGVYDLALFCRARDRVPKDWAITQNNKGAVLRELGLLEQNPVHLRSAIETYTSTLDVWSHEGAPYAWAAAQHNLGGVMRALGTLEKDLFSVKRATEHYENALLVRTREGSPSEWAMTQSNLGAAYMLLGRMFKDHNYLQQSSNAFEASLLVRTHEKFPVQWAMTEANLAQLDLIFYSLSSDPSRLASAKRRVLAAKEVFVATKATAYVQMADQILAKIDAA